MGLLFCHKIRNMKLLAVMFFLCIGAACQNPSNSSGIGDTKQDKSIPGAESPKQTILKLFDEAASIDSLVILYFKDKEKFRFYTFYTTANVQPLSLLKENLNLDTIANKECLKDGTIYGYIKGSIYTTLYFNLSDSCEYLRLFKNGKLYNYPLGYSFKEELKSLKKLAKNP